MRRVVTISAAGLRRGIAHVAPGVDEREIAAEIEYEFKKRGAQLIAYGADLQSGPNGLRSFIDVDASYDLRNRTMRAGEVALIDHSAEANYYVSDLARTVPVSGRFTPDQRLAYDIYLAAYEAGLAEIKPGVPYMNASRVAGKALESRLETLPAWLKGPAMRVRQNARDRNARALSGDEPAHPRRLRFAARSRSGGRVRIGVQDPGTRLAIHGGRCRPGDGGWSRGAVRRFASYGGRDRADDAPCTETPGSLDLAPRWSSPLERFPLTHARPNDPGGDRKLPDVTHRVLRAMHEATDDGRRKPGPSHAAKVAECCHIDRAKLRNGRVNSRGEGAQNWRDVRDEKFLTFQLNRRELLWR